MTIIGDAAHAGLPNGQGLNLAIEDGKSTVQPLFVCMQLLDSQQLLHQTAQCTLEPFISGNKILCQLRVFKWVCGLCRCRARVAFEGGRRHCRVPEAVQCRARAPRARCAHKGASLQPT